jgi:hypothetical protein
MVFYISIKPINCPGILHSFFIPVNKEYKDATYFDVKMAIFEKIGLFINYQRLILCGEEKKDNMLVSEDDILKKTCLHLVSVNMEKN